MLRGLSMTAVHRLLTRSPLIPPHSMDPRSVVGATAGGDRGAATLAGVELLEELEDMDRLLDARGVVDAGQGLLEAPLSIGLRWPLLVVATTCALAGGRGRRVRRLVR